MTSRTDRDHKTAKKLFLEQAAAYFDDLNIAADNAPYGQVFNHAKAFCVKQGRAFIRISLEKRKVKCQQNVYAPHYVGFMVAYV